jgi:hypothetical protein
MSMYLTQREIANAVFRSEMFPRRSLNFEAVFHGDPRFRPSADYDVRVSVRSLPGGVVHEMPTDLREALLANATALAAWNDITPLARNEFICWVEDAKQEATRARRIRRTQEELEEGQRRPCCWPGCKHRDRTGT